MDNKALNELFEVLANIQSQEEMAKFLKDLCTPQELNTLAERWKVCKLLNQGDLSYREINELTGASLATITRVSRFLKDEPYKGYRLILDRIRDKEGK